MENISKTVKSIVYGSEEYYQSCKLRYRVFYAPHNLPEDIVMDSRESKYFHGGIIIRGKAIAYGQIVPQYDLIYQIRQMAVEPAYQKQGLGRQILLYLLNFAQQQDVKEIGLNSRLTAVNFYQKLGFTTCGIEFPSPTTGITHIPMIKKL